MNVNREKLVVVAFAIFALTVWLYWPSTRGGFLMYMDDDEDLQQSVRFHGVSWGSVKYAFTTTQPYYNPLSRLSRYLDYQIWGPNAAGHHAAGVVIHALNATLVFGFLWTLLGAASLATGERLGVALGVALVFAIHPLQTESVAWLSCRTHLLCTTFGVGCLWAYVAGARRWVVVALFVAALLSKPIAVSLPFVMLAIDYFPLRRHEQLGWGRLIREKAVLIGVGLLSSVVTLITETHTGGMMVSLQTASPMQRVLLMFQSLAFYPWRLVCPTHLSPFYPLWLGLLTGHWEALVIGTVIITGLAMRYRRETPAIAACWGAYLVLVLPTSGLLQSGMESVALRYAYLAMLPLLLLGGVAVIWAWRRSRTIARLSLVGVVVLGLTVCAARTRSLIPDWRDSETLWRAALAQFPNSVIANRALAMTLLGEGRIKKALEYAQREVELAPQSAQAHMTLSVILGRLGRLQDAVEECEAAVRLRPESAEAQSNLANALARIGKIEEAVGYYERSLRIKPDSPETHCNFGVALARAGKTQDAVVQFQQALQLRPDFVAAKDALTALQSRPERIEVRGPRQP
jgi:Tfp pilus assembly protein PilF